MSAENKKRIVVTGLGVVSSIGVGKTAFWDNLIKGKSGISKVESFDTRGHATHVGGEVKDFNPAGFINKKRVKLMGRASQLAVAASKLAVEDAGLKEDFLSDNTVCVCIGTTMGEIQLMENMNRFWLKDGLKGVDKLSAYQSPVNSIAANVAHEFRLRGRNRMFTTACASGNYAIGYGYDLLQADEADLVVVGGSDTFSWISFTGFNKVGATAPEKCQPFDKNRQGMIPGEGAGILVLEPLENALKRKAVIYAEILGYGLSCDAFHITQPSEDGIFRCMKNAIEEAGIEAKDIDYVSAHGTGTPHNDKVEAAAIKNVFGENKVAVSSIKSMLGHTMGAASAIGTISCCLSIEHNVIPPTINYETPDPECDIDCVPNKARKQKVNIAINNGFAFGGNNAGLIIGKFIK